MNVDAGEPRGASEANAAKGSAEAGGRAISPREAVEMDIAAYPSGTPLVIVVDDLAALDEATRSVLSRASADGAKLVVVGGENDVRPMAKGRTRAFVVPPLDARSVEELVNRAAPSLPDAVRPNLVARVQGRPGMLRAFLRKARGRAIVSPEDIDAIFASSSTSIAPPSRSRGEALGAIDVALDRGRFDEATEQIERLGAARDPEERVRLAVADARIVLARAETQRAAKVLDAVATEARATRLLRAWAAVRARTHLRAGEYAQALALADEALAEKKEDAIASDALSVRGLALSFTSEDAGALAAIERATLPSRAGPATSGSGGRRASGSLGDACTSARGARRRRSERVRRVARRGGGGRGDALGPCTPPRA